jgi:hypothetical protein
MKVLVTLDLENRFRADKDLLEACVRDSVLMFNLHVGGAKVELVRFCSDDATGYLLGPASRGNRSVVCANGDGED